MRYSLQFIGGILLAAASCSAIAVAVPESQPFPVPNGGLIPRALKDATPSYARGPDPGKRNWDVAVSQTEHVFDPQEVIAEIGDTITFTFYSTQHSVVLAAYKSPCAPWSMTHTGQEDVWSGMIFGNRQNSPKWTMRVSTKDPRFYYCSSPNSCTEYGMVFAVNPTESENWNDFQIRAKKRDDQYSPGEELSPEGGETNETSDPNDKPGMSTGAIAGIAVGGVAAIALIGLLFFFVGRSRRAPKKEEPSGPVATGEGPAPTPTAGGFDHPPPGYDQRYSTATPAHWEGKPPLSPGPQSPHLSAGFPSPRPGHSSWAPSELGAQEASRPVEIYTPGVDERVPLNTGPN